MFIVVAQGLEIQSFTSNDDDLHPSHFYLTLKPTEEAKRATMVYLKVRGEGQYGTQTWPNATLSNLTADWDVPDSRITYALKRDRSYTLWVSTDSVYWGEPFMIDCCERQRPPNQKTKVISGFWNSSITEDYDKILISSSAIIGSCLYIKTRWELTIESNATFIVSPDRCASWIESFVYTINLTGVHINLAFDPDFKGFPNVKHDVNVAALSSHAFIGEFASITPVGESPICKYLGNRLGPTIGYLSVYVSFECPITSVWASDYIILVVSICVIVYIVIIVALSKKWDVSRWKLTNTVFGISFAWIFLTGLLIEIILVNNEKRCKEDPFCYLAMDDYYTGYVPIAIFLPMTMLLFIWINVAACAFPHSSSKERFCMQSSAIGRSAWYFFGLSGIIILIFFAFFGPIQFTWGTMSDGMSFSQLLAIIAGPIFGIFALIPIIIFLSTLCCKCSCITTRSCITTQFEDICEYEAIPDAGY